MARKPRIHFRGAVYHVSLSGIDKQAVFKTVADRRLWLSLIEDGAQRFGYTVHAYSLGSHLIQMAVQVNNTPLSKIMQNITFRYTRGFNTAHGTHGALFHGRYKAIVVDADHYLNDLVRYIHNSPGRDGQRKAVKWTSHPFYMGTEECPEWLTTDVVLKSFGASPRKAVRAFERFVEAGKGEGERPDLASGTQGGRILGDKRFVKKVLKPAKPPAPAAITLSQLVKRVCTEEGIKEAVLSNDSRARRESQIRQTITYLAMEMNIATLTTMSKRFRRDLTTMSRNQRYYRDKLAEDSALQKHVRKLKTKVLSA